MGIIRKFLGPSSKYDGNLPYTYIAKIPAVKGDKDIINYYFADTVCGLIEYLDEKNISPEDVSLFGCYKKREIPIDIKYCLSKDGEWLKRPDICRSLEKHYQETMEFQYKGHIESAECAFDDRDRTGSGPF
ncbi:MAG: hypothetical protein Kow0098_01960 [Ignavibacteriaceae bacterium]